MTPAGNRGVSCFSMRTPGLNDRARAAPRARLWSWLGVGALVAVVGVAVLYGVTVEPSLLPASRAGVRPAAVPLRRRRAHGASSGQSARGRERQDADGHVRRELVPGLPSRCTRICTRPRRARTPRSTSRSWRSTSATRRRAPPCSATSASPSTSFRSRCSTRRTGELVGDTFAGELKPSRHFSSREIRDFLREVVDYHRIVSPDQRQ